MTISNDIAKIDGNELIVIGQLIPKWNIPLSNTMLRIEKITAKRLLVTMYCKEDGRIKQIA
jgi:hypothetical protein